ncbi:MAG: hypothetical protein WBZ36_28225 [Candidatus Nitrosopolaris sp.]
MSTAENKRIAETFIDEIFNKGILEGVNRFVTADFTYHVRGEDITGTENFKEWVPQIVAYFRISGIQY